MVPYISVFEMLKIGVGPSSSHTLGPWKAAYQWSAELHAEGIHKQLKNIRVTLYGSLALTGKGHSTDKAVLLGLLGEDPETTDIHQLNAKCEKVYSDKKIVLQGALTAVEFNPETDLVFVKNLSLPYHPNGMKLEAFTHSGKCIESIYYSIGGGFIVKEGEIAAVDNPLEPVYVCRNASDMAKHCTDLEMSISDIVFENEKLLLPEPEIRKKLLNIWKVMKEAAFIGCHTQGELPGGLHVKRRAYDLNKQLLRVHTYSGADEWMEAMKEGRDFSKVITRISCIALAVNEVNAAMGRIVTAPTNGSSGVIPAVLFYYLCFSGKETSEDDIVRFLLTAAEIGKYFKMGATISAASGGCQAEIGVSSSMAAAALTERLGGTPAQALMAAEMAAEHHLGLTCDPVGGLVQIPCIERNSMGAVKAITASMIALASEPGSAKVSLDQVIKTMKETAENMSSKYKETSMGGLAVNVGIPEC
jgi:L-serine dehydratase